MPEKKKPTAPQKTTESDRQRAGGAPEETEGGVPEKAACCASPPAFENSVPPASGHVPPASCRQVPPASRRQPDAPPPAQETSRIGATPEPAAPPANSESLAAAGPGDSERAFTAFMREANKGGRVDARAKRLMAIALSIAQKCEPCLKIHMNKAREEGLSMEEIDEAAWVAISFCGSPAMMFYKEVRKQAAE